METQPERRVSSKEVLDFLMEVKALAEQEKKAKEQQKARDGSYQVTSSFRA